MPKVAQERLEQRGNVNAPSRKRRGRNEPKDPDFISMTRKLKLGPNTHASETSDDPTYSDAPTPGLFYGDYPTVSSTTVSTPRETTTSNPRKKRTTIGDDDYDFPHAQYVSKWQVEAPVEVGENVAQHRHLDATVSPAYTLQYVRDERVTPTDATKLAPAYKATGSPHGPIVHANCGQLNHMELNASTVTGFDDQYATPTVNTFGGAPLRGMPRQSLLSEQQPGLMTLNNPLQVHPTVDVVHAADSAVTHVTPAVHGTHGTPIPNLPTYNGYLKSPIDAVHEEPKDWSVLFASHSVGGFPAVDGFPDATERGNADVQTGLVYNVVGDYANNEYVGQLQAVEQPMVESAVPSQPWCNPYGYANGRIPDPHEPLPFSFQAPPNAVNGYPVTQLVCVPSSAGGHGGLYIPPMTMQDGCTVGSAQFPIGGSALNPTSGSTALYTQPVASSSHDFSGTFGDTSINGFSTETFYAIPAQTNVQNPPLDLPLIDQFPALGLHPGHAAPPSPNSYTCSGQVEMQNTATPRGSPLLPVVVIKWKFKFKYFTTEVITPTHPYPQLPRAICSCNCVVTAKCRGPADAPHPSGSSVNSDEGTYHFIASHMMWSFYMGNALVGTKESEVIGNRSTTSCAICEDPVCVRWSLAVGHDNNDSDAN